MKVTCHPRLGGACPQDRRGHRNTGLYVFISKSYLNMVFSTYARRYPALRSCSSSSGEKSYTN